ncbi:MAG: hypothetical protein EXS32_03690 [Opitutus sp.]|nr:hypothetical protein [Opitutus sp.]
MIEARGLEGLPVPNQRPSGANMKTKSLLLAFLLVSSVASFTASDVAVLLMGNEISSNREDPTVQGSAKAMIKATTGTTSVTADKIIFVTRESILQCSGNITVAGVKIEEPNLAIPLGHSPNVYLLNPNGIIANGKGTSDTIYEAHLDDRRESSPNGAQFESPGCNPGKTDPPFCQSPERAKPIRERFAHSGL